MPELHPKLHLDLAVSNVYKEHVLDLIVNCSRQFGVIKRVTQKFRESIEVALDLIIEKNLHNPEDAPLGIDIFPVAGKVCVEITNHGIPIFASGQTDGNVSLNKLLDLHDSVHDFETISVENCGRGGQKIIFEVKTLDKYKNLALLDRLADKTEDLIQIDPDTVEIRALRKNEGASLSQLFYRVYGYSYINDFVYYPEKIENMVATKKLLSFVAALPNNQIVGHVGLLRSNEIPLVYEPCLGVTDPSIKAQGLFRRLFAKVMLKVKETEAIYCFSDCVTNHIYSQKLVSYYGACDVAIFAGSQSNATQAKLGKLGMGADPENMDRYSILYSILPLSNHPFGQTINLPESIGEMIGFLLGPLNIEWSPTSRFDSLNREGKYETTLQPSQGAIFFDFILPGKHAAQDIISQWHEIMRNGFSYAAVDIPIDISGLGILHDIFSCAGFFISGFVPYNLSDKLAVRFQAVAPKKVAFDQIKVFSEQAKSLLKIIQQDYENNRLL